MFKGAASLNLDAKGRIAMPTRHRERLMELCGGRMITTLDRDRCLLIYPEPEWETIEERLMALSPFKPGVRDLQRVMIGYATEGELDGQGRLLVPGPLRAVAELDKHVVLIGLGNKFELWDEAAWSTRVAESLSGGSMSQSANEYMGDLHI